MTVDRPGWFVRSKSWSTRRHLAVAAVIVIGVAIGISTFVPNDREKNKASVAFADLTVPSETPLVTLATQLPSSAPTGAADEPVPTAVPTTVLTAVSTTTPAMPTVDGLNALDVLSSIPVEVEHREGYDRDLFAVWSDLDGDGCDTRADVLIDESLTLAQVDIFGCVVIAGDWFSAYDGVTISDPAELDIDHLVPLNEVWKSGGWEWTPAERIAYANDTTDPRTLVAVTAQSNRSKGDRDPAMWLPGDSSECDYVTGWLAVKARWNLSMDNYERVRISELLEGPCRGEGIDHWAPVPMIAAPP